MPDLAPPHQRARDALVLPGAWYRSDQGIVFRVVGEWDFLLGTDGWISGDIEIRDGKRVSRGIAQVNILSSEMIYPWFTRFVRWISGKTARERQNIKLLMGLYNLEKPSGSID